MRRIGFLLLVVILVGSARNTRAQATQHIAGVDTARSRFLEALSKKDTALFGTAMTNDAITLFQQSGGGQTNFGLPAITAFYAKLFGGVQKSLEMQFTPDDVTRIKDSAFETGSWKMPAFGTSGVYETVYRKGTDNKWRIAFWEARPRSAP